MGRETEIFEKTIKLDALYDEWNYVASCGGRSFVWTDGKELNSIRAGIARYMQELKETGYEEVTAGRELPVLMDDAYIRDAEGLLVQAEETLAMYLENEDYRYLAENVPFLSRRDLECLQTQPEKLLDDIEEFRKAVRRKDPVFCRKFSDREKYLAVFKRCREEVEINVEGMIPFS